MKDHSFDKPLTTQYSPHASVKLGRDLWIVTESFNYWLDNTQTRRVHIPQGYLTDGASVPKVFQKLVPAWGPYGQAAVVHDWLCEYLVVWNEQLGHYESITRSECDNYFNDAMRVLGVPNTTRRVMWNAVRVYGHLYSVIYQQHDHEKSEMTEVLLKHYRNTGYWL